MNKPFITYKEENEQLRDKVRELEEENARLKAECDDIKQVQFPRKLEAVAAGWKKRLAASQLHAEQLREKIEALWDIIDDIDSYGDMAKADDKLFRSLVEKRQKDRWETGITTDGYVLNMPIPRNISALDAYVSEKVKEAISTQKEYYEGVFQDEANRIAKLKEQLAAVVKPKKVKVLAWLVENTWVQWRAEDSLPPSINPDEFKRLPALDKEIEV